MERSATLAIEGMSCGACVKGVTAVLTRLEGVTPQRVEVGSAEVQFDDTKASPAAIAQALTTAGYPSQPRETAS